MYAFDDNTLFTNTFDNVCDEHWNHLIHFSLENDLIFL